MNPGSLKWIPFDASNTAQTAKAITSEYTPKVMIRNTTMT